MSKCEHGKKKYYCKDCGGQGICEHSRRKDSCKECGSVCEHGNTKYRCKECGLGYCEHDKLKHQCKDCGGSSICEHSKRKAYCKDCGGSGYCEHGKRRAYCRDCGGSEFCEHSKRKFYCKECNGSQLCKSEWCETRSNPKFNGYCLSCCVQFCPDIEVSRNYKTKENEVVGKIVSFFPNFTWVCDKKIQDGCSKRRPDLLLDLGSHIIIVEVDENKHIDYDCICENKRLMEISRDLGHRSIVFIRFNPDSYTNEHGVLIKSCWKINKSSGLMKIAKTEEWEERINALKDQIQYFVENPSDKTIEIIELFY